MKVNTIFVIVVNILKQGIFRQYKYYLKYDIAVNCNVISVHKREKAEDALIKQIECYEATRAKLSAAIENGNLAKIEKAEEKRNHFE